MVGIQLSIMLSVLDMTIVNPALTAISTDLHSVDRLSWIIVGYFLTSTAMTPIYGKLSDIYGRRKLIVTAISIFVGASVLCALSQTLLELSIARAIQGIGGGGLIVLAQAMIADYISARDRGTYQAFTSSTWAVSGALGPVIGGVFSDHLGWRYIFWINIPLGLLALFFCLRLRTSFVPPARRTGLDLLGAALLTAGVSLVLLVVSQSTAVWTPAMFAEVAAGVVLLGAFVVQERRAADPILPPRLYANSVIVWTNVSGFLLSALQYSSYVLLPVFLQLIIGVSATQSGLMIIPMLVIMPTSSIFVGQYMTRTGKYRAVMPIAFVLTCIAFIMFAWMTPATNLATIEFAMLLLGFGLGMCGPVLMTATQNAAQSGDIGAATSSVTFLRSLGASIGTASFWALLLVPLASASAASAQALFRGGHAGLAGLAEDQRVHVLALLAEGFHHVFALAASVSLASAIFTIFLREEALKTVPRAAVAHAADAVLME
jgi:EmrB/QacA subfamily drug resistance transporter